MLSGRLERNRPAALETYDWFFKKDIVFHAICLFPGQMCSRAGKDKSGLTLSTGQSIVGHEQGQYFTTEDILYLFGSRCGA